MKFDKPNDKTLKELDRFFVCEHVAREQVCVFKFIFA